MSRARPTRNGGAPLHRVGLRRSPTQQGGSPKRLGRPAPTHPTSLGPGVRGCVSAPRKPTPARFLPALTQPGSPAAATDSLMPHFAPIAAGSKKQVDSGRQSRNNRLGRRLRSTDGLLRTRQLEGADAPAFLLQP